MSATVQPLHPEHAERLAPAAPAGQVLTALESLASTLITEHLQSLFQSADDVLFEMANKAPYGNEKQSYLSTMRTVRLERPRILKAFQDALHQALKNPDAAAAPAEVDLDDFEKWTLQESSDLEEKLAVANMDEKAGTLYAKELAELEQRLASLADRSGGAVSPKALCPARILDAFRISMKGLDVELPAKLVMYKLFDRVVVNNLGPVFSGANQMLEERGIAPKSAPTPPKKPKPKPQAQGAAPHAAFAGPAYGAPAGPELPGAFRDMASGLHHGGLASAIQGYFASQQRGAAAANLAAGQPTPAVLNLQQNTQLADEMLAVLDAAGRGRPVDSWMPTQNLTLVSRMFDDYYADPQLPEAARPVLGRLQFPVMKLAMSDPSFFANPNHPVRALVHDVYENLTSASARPDVDFHGVEHLVQDLLQSFEPDPAAVRKQARAAHPVTEEEAERFLSQQRDRLGRQKRALQEKIRRIVAQELRLHIGERRLPKAVLPLFLSAFGPVLVTHYRAGGQDHAGWRDTLALLDRVLEAVDLAAVAGQGHEARSETICDELVSWLGAAGYSTAKIATLVDPVLAALQELAAGAELRAEAAMPATAAPDAAVPAAAVLPAAPVPTVPSTPTRAVPDAAAERRRALDVILHTGQWFKVWCQGSSNCRWLKLDQHHPSADLVVFEDFGGENRLKLRASAFVADLVADRSTPVDPDPTVRRLIQGLGPSAPPADRGEAWYKAAAPAATAA